MNYHPYEYGYDPYQGQPTHAHPYQADPGHPSVQPKTSSVVPGLYAASPQGLHDQNQNIIPGLAFGNTAQGTNWHQQQSQSQQAPSLVPAAKYYQSQFANGEKPDQNPPATPLVGTVSAEETVEEGELSEGEYDDFYEPAEAGVMIDEEEDGYEPQESEWHNEAAGKTSNASRGASLSRDNGRERSGSYSPYLSPHEIQSPVKAQPLPAPDRSPRSLMDVKKRAQSAILNLWPLNVRYKDFVEAGIDPAILRELFKELGLDMPTANTVSSAPQMPETRSTSRGPSLGGGASPHQASKPTVSLSPSAVNTTAGQTAPSQAAPSAASKAEERKDRIARLLAAKSGKASTSSPTAPETQTLPSQGENASQASLLSEKQIQQQQKMDALRKSREARAQKAASQKASAVATDTTRDTSAPIAPQPGNVETAPLRPAESDADAPSSNIAPSTIPGLFMPSTAQSTTTTNQRKRPVAADFVSGSSANGHKRPFGQGRNDRLVIDVSEGSDDEDVEMDMGSGDESTLQRNATPLERTTSFRDVPPLSGSRSQRQLSSPGPKNQLTPPNGELAVMDKQIEEMRRRIAMAEARKKLKSVMAGNKEAQTVQSNGAPSGAATPLVRRVQSVDPAPASNDITGRSSPVEMETEKTSLKLPKLSEMSDAAKSLRRDRVRTLSQDLSSVEGKLQTKTTKLRVLQAQISRLEKEIEQVNADKKQMTDELHQLEQPDETSNPGSAEFEAERSVGALPTMTIEVAANQIAQEPEADQGRVAEHEAPTTDAALPADSLLAESTNEKAMSSTDDFVHVEPDSIAGYGKDEAAQVAVDAPATASLDADIGAAPSPSPQSSSSQAPTAGGNDNEPMDLNITVVDTRSDRRSASSSSKQDEGFPSAPDSADSQQHSPKAPSVPDQISTGVNDSNPDTGLGVTRENSTGHTDCHRSAETESGFTAYHSPLEYFRAYRYHPDFAAKVLGGLRSLTYSNKIDPNLPICPDQLEGRQCPKGTDCEFQHFDSMKLPDDQILLQLGGTSLEGPERAQFNNGLRELLHDLRERNIKDFPRIAQGIVEYRNRFGGDPSKVLSLGDIQL